LNKPPVAPLPDQDRLRTRFLEDFEIGERWVSAPTTISAEEIVAFARDNDPQPMHVDAEAARNGPFGGLIASGWQIAAMSMRLFLQAGGYGKTPMVGMGVDELRWRKPVKPGDTLTVEREIVDVSRSTSQPDRGTIRTQVSVRNQHGDVVMTLISMGRVPARPAIAP